MDLKEEMITRLEEIKKYRITPLALRDWLFGKGFVYHKEWDDIIEILERIREEREDLKPVISKARKLLYLSDEIYEKHLYGSIEGLDNSMTYLKLRSYTGSKEKFIPRFKGLVAEWNKNYPTRVIEIDEDRLIRNDRLDTKYIEPIMTVIDVELNKRKYPEEFGGDEE